MTSPTPRDHVSAPTDPPDLAQWSLHCFCVGARSTPHRVVAADDNGRLLYHARGGTTRGELRRRGIECLDSQLLLLRAYGLLDIDGERLRTRFPTFGAAEMIALRARVAVVGAKVAPAIADDAHGIGETLRAAGHGAHAYAIVFGHALDGISWELLRARESLPSTALSIERPYWNGAFWAVYPRRVDAAGTNETKADGRTLVTVWTDASLAGLDALAGRWQCGESLQAPIVIPVATDPLHAACTAIARKTVAALDPLVRDLHALHANSCTPAEMLLVAGHELIWETAEQLVRLGALAAPRALAHPGSVPREIAALTFIRADA